MKSKMGDFSNMEGNAQLGLDKLGGALQPFYIALKTCRVADIGNIDIGKRKVAGNIYPRYRNKGSNPRVFDPAFQNKGADHLLDQTSKPLGPKLCHVIATSVRLAIVLTVAELSRNLDHFDHLELIANLYVIKSFQANTTFVTGCNFAGIVLETPQ